MRVFSLMLALIAIVCSASTAGQTLSYVDLVKKLTDLEALAVLPAPGEKCQQWSSYDRASSYDSATGKYVNWDANGDGGGVIGREDDCVVMAEMDGPGCIWRIWSAAPKAGHVRIFLDGAAEPAVDMPFADYFNLENPPFCYPGLVHVTSSGSNSYIPIPFARSCKIVADKNWGNYYQFTYSTFPKDTVVPTFNRELSQAETAALEAASKQVTDGLGGDPVGKRANGVVETRKLVISAGKTVTLARILGPRAITAIRISPGPIADRWKTLRSMALRITWDGEKKPSVWCPLGDFFGTAPGINYYKSLPLGMTAEGFYSHWYMPFAGSAVVELVNDGNCDVAINTSITHSPLPQGAAELGRFHAKWHRDATVPAEPERRIDWPMLKTTGKGRFCGVMLHVYNPGGSWWGEGDEKFFVDGEKFPSTLGTGSEDYFGYAWSNPKLFQNAYHNQTFNDKGNAGNLSVNRWQIADNVPFRKSFEAYIEKYFANEHPTLYACTAYWYEAPGGGDAYVATGVGERAGYFGNAGM